MPQNVITTSFNTHCSHVHKKPTDAPTIKNYKQNFYMISSFLDFIMPTNFKIQFIHSLTQQTKTTEDVRSPLFFVVCFSRHKEECPSACCI